MKALVYEGAYQMPLRQVPLPEPNADEVIVKVEAVGVCGSDVHGYKGTTGRRKPPIVMGHEFAGTLAAVGAAVKEHRVGERVHAPVHPRPEASFSGTQAEGIKE